MTGAEYCHAKRLCLTQYSRSDLLGLNTECSSSLFVNLPRRRELASHVECAGAATMPVRSRSLPRGTRPLGRDEEPSSPAVKREREVDWSKLWSAPFDPEMNPFHPETSLRWDQARARLPVGQNLNGPTRGSFFCVACRNPKGPTDYKAARLEAKRKPRWAAERQRGFAEPSMRRSAEGPVLRECGYRSHRSK